MLPVIICQGNGFPGQFFAIEKELIYLGSIGCQAADGDVIIGLSVAVLDFIRRPTFRQTRSQPQLLTFEVHTQQGFNQQSIQPAGGTGVPRPAAPARKRRDRIDIRSLFTP